MALQGNADCVRLLLKAGADKEVKDSCQRTPLHWSAKVGPALHKPGHDLVAQILLKEAAPPCEA